MERVMPQVSAQGQQKVVIRIEKLPETPSRFMIATVMEALDSKKIPHDVQESKGDLMQLNNFDESARTILERVIETARGGSGPMLYAHLHTMTAEFEYEESGDTGVAYLALAATLGSHSKLDLQICAYSDEEIPDVLLESIATTRQKALSLMPDIQIEEKSEAGAFALNVSSVVCHGMLDLMRDGIPESLGTLH